MSQRTALVTGASRGIGRAIAAELLSRGWNVVATCRIPGELNAAERLERVRYLPYDAANPEGPAELARQAGMVDVLINNAGASPIGPAEEALPEKVLELFQLNLFSAIQLTRAILPGMRERRRGTVMFIGSMRSEVPSPFSSLYSASKAAVRSFAQCLRMEVRSYGIRVCVVAPLYIRTSLGQEMVMNPGSPYAAAVGRVKASRDMDIVRAAPPEVVARIVARLLRSRRPKAFSFAGRRARLQGFLARHLPAGVVEASMARRFNLGG
jgi:NAD(P)-dependent dehydrogenase (short-subunit alcohol dehydrogenase family)